MEISVKPDSGMVYFNIMGIKYQLPIENDNPSATISSFFDKLEIGYLPGEAGFAYDNIPGKIIIIKNMCMYDIEKEKKQQMHQRMIELGKEFDKPIPDEVIDEIEYISMTISHMKPEDWLKTFI